MTTPQLPHPRRGQGSNPHPRGYRWVPCPAPQGPRPFFSLPSPWTLGRLPSWQSPRLPTGRLPPTLVPSDRAPRRSETESSRSQSFSHSLSLLKKDKLLKCSLKQRRVWLLIPTAASVRAAPGSVPGPGECVFLPEPWICCPRVVRSAHLHTHLLHLCNEG